MKLFFHDINEVENEVFLKERDFDAAVEFIHNYGIPSYIAFNYKENYCLSHHDVDEGYNFVKILIQLDSQNIKNFPKNFTYTVNCKDFIQKNNIYF